MNPPDSAPPAQPDDPSKRVVTSDAVVTYSDALDWAAELMPTKPQVLAEQLGAVEPALAGLAGALADRAGNTIRKLGYPAGHADLTAARVFHAGLVLAEVARRGYRKFAFDLVEPQGGEAADPQDRGRGCQVKNPPRKRPPSVFALAAASSGVSASIDVDDLMAVRRDWTREQAQKFLAQHAQDLGTAMIQAGMATLIVLAERSTRDAN